MGTNTLLLGATGSGKTYSTRSLVTDCGLETFWLFTEPSMETIDGNSQIPGLSCEGGAHYHYVAPANPGWDVLLDNAQKINTLSFESLSKLEHVNKSYYDQFLDVIRACRDFTCARCGQSFGAVDSWANDRALVIDSLSGLNIMAMDMVTGAKPVKSIGNWGVAMDNLERFVNMLCSSTKCYLVMTAHIERELDEAAGMTQLMVSTLGKKLAPRLPRFFSDVVLCRRDGREFSWNTATVGVDLKSRTLPIEEGMKPTFHSIVRANEQS